MSSPSYRKVNYTIRPAKSIERKMIMECCARLCNFQSLDAYRYIGLGSPYFSDFLLVHRSLGIENMLCLEKEVLDAERFKFNRPFDCIVFDFRKTTEALPTLEWRDTPTIIWLDYDSAMNDEMLADIHVVFGNISPGGMVILTMRAVASDFGEKPKARIGELQKAIPDRVPTGTLYREVTGNHFPRLLWQIIDNEIRHVVAKRNSGLDYNTAFEYRQTLHFRYADGAQMLTIGGIVYQRGQIAAFNQCRFDALHFMRNGFEPYTIEVPRITLKEQRSLQEQLPKGTPSAPRVPDKDVQAYASNYRYFPTFVESEL